MRSEAVEKAKANLRRAEEALLRMEEKNGYARFDDHWADLLWASNRVYTALEQGAKGHPKSYAWFGKKKAERKTDPLLRYMHQARNADEHGLEKSFELSESQTEMMFDPNKPISVEQKYHRDVSTVAQVGAPDHSQGTKTLKILKGDEVLAEKQVPADHNTIKTKSYYFKTAPVKNQGVDFDVPKTHLGLPLEGGSGPRNLARLVIEYQRRLLEEAEAL